MFGAMCRWARVSMTATLPPTPAPTLIWKVYRIPDDSPASVKHLPRRMRSWEGLARWMRSIDAQRLPRARERILKSLTAQGHSINPNSTALSERLGYDGAVKWRVLWARLLDGVFCFPPPHIGIAAGLLTGQFIDLTRIAAVSVPTPGVPKAPRACEICDVPLTQHLYCQGCGCLVGLNHSNALTSSITVLERGAGLVTLNLCPFCARMLTNAGWQFEEESVLRLMGQLIREALLDGIGQVQDPCFWLLCRSVGLDAPTVYQDWCRRHDLAYQPPTVLDVCKARLPRLSSLRSALDGSTGRPKVAMSAQGHRERKKVRA